MVFAHLHVHSAYSFLRGVAKPKELVDAAIGEGMSALALTDHNSLVGAVEFYDIANAAGIKPLMGLEVEISNPFLQSSTFVKPKSGVIVLLAAENLGWRSLCRLTSRIDEDSGQVSLENLANESSGLICLSGGTKGLLTQLFMAGEEYYAVRWLEMLHSIFPQRLYVELNNASDQQLALCEKVSLFAHRQKVSVVASQPVYYLYPHQQRLQRIASAIRNIKTIAALDIEDCAPEGAYFLSISEISQRFTRFPSALAAVQEVTERCNCSLPVGQPHFPSLEAPDGETAFEVVRRKAYEGAVEIYSSRHDSSANILEESLDKTVRERLEHELKVIQETGYAALFLIVQDILEYARASGVPTASRGSASSSLVAHCLGITTPDPIKLNLYFERFLNPARHSPPDIDTDLCSRRREEIIRYVYQRYGDHKVATICTIACFRSRSALRETAKAYGLASEEIKILADALPYHWYGSPGRGFSKDDPYADLKERFHDQTHQQIFLDAAALIGLPHHLSVHPGGVVIAPNALDDLVPTQMAAKGVRITQFDLESIERLGLVKIDLLGIRGLTVIGDVAESIVKSAKSQGIDFEPLGEVVVSLSKPKLAESLRVLAEIPEEDVGVSDMLMHGRTIGCFQIESPGMRATLREVRARKVEDILVALALYRPGPLTGGLKDAFVRRHLGKEPTIYLHPTLETVLGETYGVVLYQEQVLRIVHELAGFSLAEADLLRRAMSHFDPGQQMKTLQEKFIREAGTQSGLPPEIGQRVWELMAAFAGYGFPKAHAASYAQVAWRAAWCKLYHPAIFMAAVLANWGGYYSQRVYLTESRRMGLVVRPPNVNYARAEFSVQYIDKQPELFMGLDQVQSLTQKTIERIRRYRPFSTFDDFLARVNPRQVEAENLIKVGACSQFGSIPWLIDRLAGKRPVAGQFSFLDINNTADESDWTLEEKVAAQELLLGVSVIAHPMELAAAAIQKSGALSTVEAAARLGQPVRVAGMRQTWRRSITTQGDYIYFMSLEDLEGMLNVVIFANVYRKCKNALSTPGPYVVDGMLEFDEIQGEPIIRADRIDLL